MNQRFDCTFIIETMIVFRVLFAGKVSVYRYDIYIWYILVLPS